MYHIGLIPMAARPYHVGHDTLIRLAREECDQVFVFASTADRVRRGEFSVRADIMRKLWDDIIESLPQGVGVVFVPNPVGAVYEFIGLRNGDTMPVMKDEKLVIYSDPEDMERNFSERSLAKYGGALANARRLARRHVPRDTTVNVSGTQMRAWLMHGDKTKFVANLPETLDGDVVWKALSRR
jgi:ATP sulfurylase